MRLKWQLIHHLHFKSQARGSGLRGLFRQEAIVVSTPISQAVAIAAKRHPRYHARDVAVVRARAAGCPVLLADPLPAVETWHNVTTGQYRLIEPLPGPPARYPASFIVDMRRSPDRVMSPRLRRELELLPDGAAAMLYVNRKGVSRRVVCTGCGAALECPDCRLPRFLISRW